MGLRRFFRLEKDLYLVHIASEGERLRREAELNYKNRANIGVAEAEECSEALLQKTVACAVLRERTLSGGHGAVPFSLRAEPKEVDRHFGRFLRRKRGIEGE